MTEKIKIDFISDVVCPWCVIGYKRLEQAISEMRIQDKVELEWQPFELNPNVSAKGEDRQKYRIRKYGISAADGAVAEAQMTERGAELGFKFDYYDGMRVANTKEAHILLDYAKKIGKQTDLKMRLFEAFFSERKDVSDRQILSQELQAVGLNAEEAILQLEDDTVRKRMEKEKAHWYSKGVSGVPTIVFNNSNALTGAQPLNVYKQALAELIGQ